MIKINKRKFLTELGKLLTFMFEEDRQRALAIYERMLDEAIDETALLQFLGSPTKQAVAVARAYNAKERRLAVVSQAGEDNADILNDEEPQFVSVINGIREEAAKKGMVPEILTDRYPDFDELEESSKEETHTEPEAVQEEEKEPIPQDSGEEEPIRQEEEPYSDPVLSENPEPPAEDKAFEELPIFTLEETEEEAAEPAEEAAEEVPAEPEAAEPSEESETDTAETEQEVVPEEKAAPEQAEQPDEALETYDNNQIDLGEIPEETRVKPEEIEEMMATFREKEPAPKPVSRPSRQTTIAEFEETPPEKGTPWRQVSEEDEAASGRLSIPMMLLYLLLAVPITAAGVLALLVPTLVFLVLATVFGIAAFRVATLAFNSFAVFADIVVVLGAALVLLAVAIFIFWIFVSFVVGAIAGLINLAIRVGGKVCYREGKRA